MTTTPTVYSTIASDGTLRMALHPMDSAPMLGGFDCEPLWPFRVVFAVELIFNCGLSSWCYSCRGADCGDGSIYPPGEDVCARQYSGHDHGSDDAALAWLLEGEEVSR